MTKETRKLFEVLEKVLEAIPADELTFRKRLQSVQESVAYTPPEQMQIRWLDGAHIMHAQFGDVTPTEGWQKNVLDIWMNQ